MFVILETLADKNSTDAVYRYAEPDYYFSTLLQAEKYILHMGNIGAFEHTDYEIIELKKFIPSKDM